jgi:hypothetical protein
MTVWGADICTDRPQHPLIIELLAPIGAYVSGRLQPEIPSFFLPGMQFDQHMVQIGDLALIELGESGVWCAAHDYRAPGPDGIGLSCSAAAALGLPYGSPSGVWVTVLPGSRSRVPCLSFDDLQSHGIACARAHGLRIGGLRCD